MSAQNAASPAAVSAAHVPSRRAFAGFEVGQSIGSRTVTVSSASLIAYAAAGGDHNPIHWSDAAATAAGLPGVIAHGMFTMGAAVGLVEEWAGDPAAVRDYGTKFVAPVVVPATGEVEVEVTGTITKLDETSRLATVELAVTCGDDKVLGRPLATVELA